MNKANNANARSHSDWTSAHCNAVATVTVAKATLGHEVVYHRDLTKWCTIAGCVTSDVAHPLDIDFNNLGSPWSMIPVTDFNGDFQAKGVVKLKTPPPEKPKPRKKPELGEFAGKTTVAYSPECAEDVIEVDPDDKDKVKEAGAKMMNASDGNPCKLIGGSVEGSAPSGNWWTTYVEKTSIRGYDGTQSSPNNEKQATMTYKAYRGCESRAFSNSLAMNDIANDEAHRSMTQGMIASSIDDVCSAQTGIETTIWGVGIESEAIDTACKFANHLANNIATGIIAGNYRSQINKADRRDSADCDRRNAFNRMFCDMHCVRDAVQKGDAQILENVKGATNHLQNVFDQLMEYYTGGLADMQTYMVANQGVISGIVKTIPGVTAMFAEMKDMLGRDLDQGGRITANRALEQFRNKLSTITPEHFANASALMNDISSEATLLLSTARLASSRQLSTRSAAARQTMESMHSVNKVLQAESEMIHTFRHHSVSKKHRQHSLINPIVAVEDEVAKLNINSILTEFDRSWWTIRTKFD